MRATTRSYSKVLVARGQLAKEACAQCGDDNTEMHHPDYANPWHVVWLCDTCHRILHHELRLAQREQWVRDLDAAGALWAARFAEIDGVAS